MTANKTGGPEPRTLTVDGQVLPGEHMAIPLDKLALSPRNPRIRRLLRRNPTPTAGEIQKFLLEEDGVADLQRQIRDNGGLVDPIIVDENYEVIEGNCRLAIYMKLRDGRTHEPQWKTIPAYVLTGKVTSRQILILQAIYHVHSNKIKWGGYEQQAHLQVMRQEEGMEPVEIARVLGLSTNNVNALLDAYAAMTKHYVAKTKLGEDKKVWSHFHELFKNPKLATFRGSEKNLKTFAKLVKAGTIKGADVRRLPAIVSNGKALQKLEKQGLAAAIGEVGKGDPSKVYPLFKQMRKTTKLLRALKSKDIEGLKAQPAEQKEIRALYQAIADVAKAANIKLA
jgi:ParB-like nuclease domain